MLKDERRAEWKNRMELKHITSIDEYLKKIGTAGRHMGALPPVSEWVWSFIGCFVGIGLVTYLTFHLGVPILVASLGASACLIYGAPAVPFAQPRNAIAGHIMSAIIGVAVYQWMGNTWYAVGLSVALAVSAMVATSTIHPPAGATALIAVVTHQGWLFPILPVGAGIIILILVGIIINNLSMHRKYPLYWW